MSWKPGEKLSVQRLMRLSASIPCSYTMFKDGSIYYAEPSFSGGTSYSGTNASQVLNSIMVNNTKIHLGRGTFNLESAIPVTDQRNIYLEGEGRQTTILQFNDGVTGIEFSGTSAAMREVVIKDLTIVGKNAQLLGFSNVHDVWIDNVELVGGGITETINHPDYATMKIADESYGYVIVGLLIWDGGAAYTDYQPLNNGLFVYTSGDFKMSHSVFTGCAWEGAHFSNSSGKTVLCEFNNNNRHGLVFDTSAGCHVADSAFAYNGWSGLLIANALDYPCTAHTAIGNHFQQNGRLLDSDALQITGALSNVSHVKILGNTFWWNPAYGVGLYDYTSDVTIMGNTFAENDSGPVFKDTNVTNVHMSGNTGFVTENSGTATILNGTATVKVTHGLYGDPTSVRLTGSHAEVKNCIVTNVDPDADHLKFEVTAPDGVTSGDRTVYWTANYTL